MANNHGITGAELENPIRRAGEGHPAAFEKVVGRFEVPSAPDLVNFHVHTVSNAVRSIDELESMSCNGRHWTIRFRGLVVGIDLSDLGHTENESVDGRFIQDALDDDHFVDPALMGGLPSLK